MYNNNKTYNVGNDQLVFTIKEKCRVCYTCVRECPAKAIRIRNGQAEVIPERCIACGNCIKVCSQGAKVFLKLTEYVNELLKSDYKVAAVIAPSFPAEFDEIDDHKKLVHMIRQLGFDLVTEVAFGADLVSKEYNKRLAQNKKAYISSDCPAIVNYIEHYYPALADALMPVPSPMVAITRALRQLHGAALKVVFVGPCIAKKAESDEVDVAITFLELRDLFSEQNIRAEDAGESDFDPPHAGKGALFPVSRGLFQNIRMDEDTKEEHIIVAEGNKDFKELINEFSEGLLKHNHLELLCCEGCIMGAGTSPNGKRYKRRERVKQYVQEKMKRINQQEWEEQMKKLEDLDMSQTFHPADERLKKPSDEEITRVLQSMNKYNREDELNCGACGYETCVDHAIAIIQGLAEKEMCLPYSIEQLHESIDNLNISKEKLADAREALKQSEKLASMGQLSAGIAHELNNPLGVITMYSNILKEDQQTDDQSQKDLELIVEQAERCRKIVSGLLNFARKNQVKVEETDIEKFTHRSLDSIVKPKHVEVNFTSKMMNSKAAIDRDQMMQVLTNLEKNAIEAMSDGGTLKVELTDTKDDVMILIGDTGSGIDQKNMDKIFTPFFTTKMPGKGTGLGLPLVYGIVKMHKGQIKVTSNTDTAKGPTGTEFNIILPRKIKQN